MRECCDCRDGEKETCENDDVRLVTLRDPDTNKIYKRGYVCANHREMYAFDGYEIIESS